MKRIKKHEINKKELFSFIKEELLKKGIKMILE